jgi:hypothetical protein
MLGWVTARISAAFVCVRPRPRISCARATARSTRARSSDCVGKIEPLEEVVSDRLADLRVPLCSFSLCHNAVPVEAEEEEDEADYARRIGI